MRVTMKERSKSIFGNAMSEKTYRKAVRSKQKYAKKFGDDSEKNYPVILQKNEHIGDLLGVYDIRLGEENTAGSGTFDNEKGIIVGNIRTVSYTHLTLPTSQQV